jgi:hypothetical protein
MVFERLFRRHRLPELDPLDRFIGHVGGNVAVRIVFLCDLGHTIKNDRNPLLGLAAEKSKKLVETRIGRPAEIWPRNGLIPGRRFMPFSA